MLLGTLSMDRIDLTMYGDQELSLNVLNDEYLYSQFKSCDDVDDLRRMCEVFTYSDEQFAELQSDLEDELELMENAM